jgi:glutamate--cysteine ligase
LATTEIYTTYDTLSLHDALPILAHAGLRRRSRIDQLGRDETRHLEPLDRIVDSGKTPAEEMLEKFNGPWKGSVEPAYVEYAF